MDYSTLPDELQQYIREIHGEPYKALTDNCFHKNLKVARKAKELGLSVDVMFCWAKCPKWMRWIYPYNPHIYLIIGGVTIDLFFADWWGTERVLKGHVELRTIRGR